MQRTEGRKLEKDGKEDTRQRGARTVPEEGERESVLRLDQWKWCVLHDPHTQADQRPTVQPLVSFEEGGVGWGCRSYMAGKVKERTAFKTLRWVMYIRVNEGMFKSRKRERNLGEGWRSPVPPVTTSNKLSTTQVDLERSKKIARVEMTNLSHLRRLGPTPAEVRGWMT